MKLKRVCALMTAAATAVSLFAGCGQTSGTDNTTETATVSDTDSVDSEEEYWYVIDTTNNLSNPNATKEACALYNFICDMQGQYVISGQQENCSQNAMADMQIIQSDSGKLPAIRGLDFINDGFDTAVLHAESWWRLNGIVTIAWHMGVPGTEEGYESSQGSFDIEAALTEGTEEHELLMAEFDKAVPALQQLEDEGIPVLWRPFHEFDGGWFWWGKGTNGQNANTQFIALWQLMYDYYTNEKGLDNLIWVLGYSGSIKSDWYPGDEYVDIIGADTYGHDDSYSSMFKHLGEAVSDSKPRCLHECGYLPDPDAMVEEESMWSWFMLWYGDYLNNDYNSEEYVNKVYNSEAVLTLDELPKLTEQLQSLGE